MRGKHRDAARATQDEGARVLAALPKNAQVVALDGRGRQHSSEQLAVRMEHWRGLGRDLAFLVGGPEGHAADVIARADEQWSLGPDRKRVVEGKSVSVRVDLGGRRILKKKKNTKN